MEKLGNARYDPGAFKSVCSNKIGWVKTVTMASSYHPKEIKPEVNRKLAAATMIMEYSTHILFMTR